MFLEGGVLMWTLQCIILTIRPLLYALWQKRAEMSRPLRVSSAGSVRSLLRVCVASAHETMKILVALQAQSLLGAYIPTRWHVARRLSSSLITMARKLYTLRSRIPLVLRGSASSHRDGRPIFGQEKRVLAGKDTSNPGRNGL